MAQSIEKMVHCHGCNRMTRHLEEKPSHLLHLVLTVLTFGLWIIPWSWVTLASGKPCCTVCGFEVGRFQVKP